MPADSFSSRFAGINRASAATVLMVALGVTSAFVFTALTRDTTPPKLAPPADDPESGNDFLLFRRLGEHVRAGENYYDAAFREMRLHRFPTGSPFNFRTPTYAWLLGALPNDAWGRAVLIFLGFAALALNCWADQRELGLMRAVAAGLFFGGTAKWCLDPDGIYSQELWASMLIAVSLGAYGLGWRFAGVAAGLLALFFRELALPYCLLAASLAVWHRRRGEAAAWGIGLIAYGLFLVWHASEVTRRMTDADLARSDWFCFGGLKFDLVTARMNDFLYAAPGWILALYLSLALLGLSGWRSERGVLSAATVFLFLAAFTVIGNPYNGYWGLLYVPILAVGVVRAPTALVDLYQAAAHAHASLLQRT
jgi:hypothetical protein